MINKSIYSAFSISLCVVSAAFSQVHTQGTPFIKNYSSIEYKLHPKNFSIIQDSRGVMYFANAYGVLEFDGNSWKRVHLPQGKSAISFAKDPDGSIYVGSVGDFGVLGTNNLGSTTYTSLFDNRPENERNFEDVRKSYCLNNEQVFFSQLQISVLKEGTFKIFRPTYSDMPFDFSEEANGEIYFREPGKGLLKLNEGKLELVNNGGYFAENHIYTILPFNTKEILVLASDGLYVYNGRTIKPFICPLNDYIKENPITAGIDLRNNFYSIGALNKGLVIFDKKGNLVQIINKGNGLPSNNIYDLYLGTENNLWIVTDNGISYLQTGSSFTLINENSNLKGMGYAAFIDNHNIYLGTSQGLFMKEHNALIPPYNQTSGFQLIENFEEQVWCLDKIGGDLLCGNTQGLYVIEKNKTIKISPGTYTGGWTFKTFKDDTHLVLGTYSGLELYTKQKNGWSFKNKIEGFNESSRVIEIDDDSNIWVCHGNNGLYKIELNEGLDSAVVVENIAISQGFKSDYFNDIARIENEIVFAGDNYLYTYNKIANKLEKHPYFNSFLEQDVLIGKIIQQEDGNIWLVNRDVIEVLTKQKYGDFIKNSTIFRKLKGQLIGSYEFFWRYDDRNYFIGSQDGFVHYDPTVVEKDKSFHVLIRKVECLNDKDSLIFGGTFVNKGLYPVLSQPENQSPKIPYTHNALRFSYSALFYEDHEKNQYQYCLQKSKSSKDCKWTTWTTVTYKEYTNLPEGNYTFRVRAKNIYEQISPEATYQFVILPPWYRTSASFMAYFILAGLCFALLIKAIKIKITREKTRIEKEKEKELIIMEKLFAEETLKAEKEIILLKNEKLEAEISYKNDELVNLATNLSQKTEFLGQLKKGLESISKEVNPENDLSSLTGLIKTIDKRIEFDDGWDHFQTNFDAVHHNFLYKIREKFPFLKPVDLLLCAYIKMNKTNKEISSLLNISVSAVEKRRFRLREKLTLDNNTKLTEYLQLEI